MNVLEHSVVFGYGYTCHSVCVEFRAQLCGVNFFLPLLCSDQIQVAVLVCSKPFYPLSHPGGLFVCLFLKSLCFKYFNVDFEYTSLNFIYLLNVFNFIIFSECN